tara:strand:+ start:153 stop:770 length:618 start_codon:yes stop_codon:yes gene_type:complete
MIIVEDKEKLQQKCELVSLKEGEEIAVRLLHEIRESNSAIGLAANQIGIQKRVCVVNVKDPVILINPEIIEKSEEKFAFMEGCLSFPGEAVKTSRYKWVKVKADNHKETLYFSVWNNDSEDGYDKDKYLEMAYETACVQHEIDHLNGITMYERELKGVSMKRGINAPEKIGRNTKVLIKKDNDTMTIKYKKYDSYKEDGWTLAEV